MDAESLFQVAGGRKAFDFYRSVDLGLAAPRINLLDLWGSAVDGPIVFVGNTLRQQLMTVYDWGRVLSTLSEEETIAEHMQRDPEGCLSALRAICRLMDIFHLTVRQVVECQAPHLKPADYETLGSETLCRFRERDKENKPLKLPTTPNQRV